MIAPADVVTVPPALIAKAPTPASPITNVPVLPTRDAPPVTVMVPELPALRATSTPAAMTLPAPLTSSAPAPVPPITKFVVPNHAPSAAMSADAALPPEPSTVTSPLPATVPPLNCAAAKSRVP